MDWHFQKGCLLPSKSPHSQEPRFEAITQRLPGVAQGCAVRRGATVLPDDGVVDRLPGIPAPYDGGFALVGDADRRHPRHIAAGRRQRLAQHRRAVDVNFLRVMLDPAAGGKILRQIAPCGGTHRQIGCCKGDGPGRGGALVESKDQILGHALVFPDVFAASLRQAGASDQHRMRLHISLKPLRRATIARPPRYRRARKSTPNAAIPRSISASELGRKLSRAWSARCPTGKKIAPGP
jgi:hypothetical protein